MASSSADPPRRPRVLMATFHDWDAPLPLGSHHLAKGFVDAGWDVARVASAISPIQLLRDPAEFRDRLTGYRWRGERHLDGHLWTYTPVGLLTPHNVPLLRGAAVHRTWQRLTIPNLIRSVRSQGFAEVDLLFVDSPLQSFWLDDVTHRQSIARIGDRYAGFAGIPDEMLRMELELIRGVDVVAFTARSMEQEIVAAGAKRTLHLPNGVDFHHFADGDRSMPADLASIPHPIALYVGEMADWFDYSLVNRLADLMPDVSFVLVGPDRVARLRITPRDNVHILGRRPFGSLPGYLRNADVGLIPFDVVGHGELVNAVHPLKLYEYLACGLPAVATRWEELARLRSPAVLCDGPDDFAVAIRATITTPPDPAAGVEFARGADWSNRVRLLLESLDLLGPPPS